MTAAAQTRTVMFRALTERNARLDSAASVARLRDAGWTVASTVWAPSVPDHWDVWLKGYIMARGNAGGTLTCTLVRDPSIEPLGRLRRLAEAAGCLDGVKRVASRLNDFFPGIGDSSVAMLIATGRIPATIGGLEDLPPQVRLEAERAHARMLLEVFGSDRTSAG